MIDDMEKTIELVERFNEKHGLNSTNQALQLGAETGELQDAVLKGFKDEIREEVGDTLFVAISIALLEGIDPTEAFREVTLENHEKDGSKEGGKVSKK